MMSTFIAHDSINFVSALKEVVVVVVVVVVVGGGEYKVIKNKYKEINSSDLEICGTTDVVSMLHRRQNSVNVYPEIFSKAFEEL